MKLIMIFGAISALAGWSSWKLALAAAHSGAFPWYVASAMILLVVAVVTGGMVLIELYELIEKKETPTPSPTRRRGGEAV